MWIMTEIGFFSVVAKPGDAAANRPTLRARHRHDLENLREHYLPELEIIDGGGTDYPCRARVDRTQWADTLVKLTATLTYSNFKSRVAHTQGHARAHTYGHVWSDLLSISDEDHSAMPPSPKSKPKTKSKIAIQRAADALKQKARQPKTFGGVVIQGRRVLLREPSSHFGGYHWTFPKGRPDPSETPEAAAIRETLEETGYRVRLSPDFQDNPAMGLGTFRGDTSNTRFYLMELVDPDADPVPYDAETAAVGWFTYAEAVDRINQTTSIVGRERDLKVLAAAQPYLD